MELRPARADDLAAIIDLVPGRPVSWWNQRLQQVEPVPSVVIAGGSDRAVEGVVAIGSEGGRGLIAELVVAPAHRRQGHGRKLLLCGERILTRRGCERASIDDEATGISGPGADVDHGAAAFLTALGWIPADGGDNGDWSALLGEDGARRSHLVANRWNWDDAAAWYEGPGRRALGPEQRANPTWGCWRVPESEVGMLEGVADSDVIELGCGTGYVSAYCLDAGARSVVGIDNSPGQLATARTLQAEFDVPFPLILGDAEHSPFADASFDVAISEYGAAIWCNPHRWIPEAARLLRPGGRLVFLGNSVVSMLCVPEFEAEGAATSTMVRPQRDMHRFAWLDNMGVNFHISHGEMIRLLRQSGFEVVDLVELYVPEGATSDYEFLSAEWGGQWPAEEVWVARRLP